MNYFLKRCVKSYLYFIIDSKRFSIIRFFFHSSSRYRCLTELRYKVNTYLHNFWYHNEEELRTQELRTHDEEEV